VQPAQAQVTIDAATLAIILEGVDMTSAPRRKRYQKMARYKGPNSVPLEGERPRSR
jgi:hypothetical protein